MKDNLEKYIQLDDTAYEMKAILDELHSKRKELDDKISYLRTAFLTVVASRDALSEGVCLNCRGRKMVKLWKGDDTEPCSACGGTGLADKTVTAIEGNGKKLSP